MGTGSAVVAAKTPAASRAAAASGAVGASSPRAPLWSHAITSVTTASGIWLCCGCEVISP